MPSVILVVIITNLGRDVSPVAAALSRSGVSSAMSASHLRCLSYHQDSQRSFRTLRLIEILVGLEEGERVLCLKVCHTTAKTLIQRHKRGSMSQLVSTAARKAVRGSPLPVQEGPRMSKLKILILAIVAATGKELQAGPR